jgi:hypothetical protein
VTRLCRLPGFDDDAWRNGCLVSGPGGRIARLGVADRGHRQAGLLDRVHVVIFGPVGVLDDELAARSGHDARSRFAAPQGPGVWIAVAPERVAERHRARGFQDEPRIGAHGPGDLRAYGCHCGPGTDLDEHVHADGAVYRGGRKRDQAVDAHEGHAVQFLGKRLVDHVLVVVDPVHVLGAELFQEPGAAAGAAAEIKEGLACDIPEQRCYGIEADLVRRPLDSQ